VITLCRRLGEPPAAPPGPTSRAACPFAAGSPGTERRPSQPQAIWPNPAGPFGDGAPPASVFLIDHQHRQHTRAGQRRFATERAPTAARTVQTYQDNLTCADLCKIRLTILLAGGFMRLWNKFGTRPGHAHES
jgi:hypothetical protein